MKLFATLRWPTVFVLVLVAAATVYAQQGDRDGHVMNDPPESLEIPPAPILTPEEALGSFQLEEGFELQLVAAEPLVVDPVCMAWDAAGRLWVCEMRGYMPDIDGTGEDEPSGNIVILDDTDGDGQMDTREVFLDGIVLPRAIAHVKDGILYADQQELYYQRINEDGTAGARVIVQPAGYSGGGNVEHKANGLLYGLDNWYYSAKSNVRYQFVRGRWINRLTENRGQWGIAQDDYGRLITNSNSQFVHGELLPPSVTLRNPNADFGNRPMYSTSRAVYPIRVTPGVNRAYMDDVVDKETWRLLTCTGVSGITVYRGDQYPEEYDGNLFIPEPCGHLIKRVVLSENDGRITATHAYDDREFLASTDERNRFVNAYTGPDGCVYLLDMYRGIIQHKAYVTSYLRRQILSRGLERPGECGRIYRIVYTGNDIGERPSMSDESAVELVEHLRHDNAWWRETAQRLLVERRDVAALNPLRELAGDVSEPLGQIHALWTLDGMGALDIFTLEAAARSEDPKVRVQVIRLAERFGETDDSGRALAILMRYSDMASWEIDMQICLSAGILAGIDTPQGYDLLVTLLERRGEDSLFRRAMLSSLSGKEAVMLARVIDSGGPFVAELTAAIGKAVEDNNLSADAMDELIDSEMMLARPERRLQMLTDLAANTLLNQRSGTALDLIERMAGDTDGADTQAILQGFASMNTDPRKLGPIQLEAEPELFAQWRVEPSEAIAAHLPLLEEGQVFDYTPPIYGDEVEAMIAQGLVLYESTCSECHGSNGRWIEGQNGPPLGKSQWVQGPTRQIAALVLHGVRGPIKVGDTVYEAPMIQSEMPGYIKNDSLGDEELAAILTYTRQAWGNAADPIYPSDIAEMRELTASREGSYTVPELRAIRAKEGEVVAQGARPKPNGIDKPGWLSNKPLGLGVMLGAVFVLMLGILGVTLLVERQ